MKPTKLNNLIAKKHFGIVNHDRQVELMLTTTGSLLQIVEGVYSTQQHKQGKTAEEAFDMIRASMPDTVVDFAVLEN